MKTVINSGLVPPQNTPRSVTMLPLSNTPSFWFVPTDGPLFKDPRPHYQDYLDGVMKSKGEFEEKKHKKRDR